MQHSGVRTLATGVVKDGSTVHSSAVAFMYSLREVSRWLVSKGRNRQYEASNRCSTHVSLVGETARLSSHTRRRYLRHTRLRICLA